MNNYKNSVEIDSPPNRIFAAISKELGNWWGNQDKPILRNGTIFKVAWGEPWYQFEVSHYMVNREMSWTCIDANQIIEGLTGVEKEWVGSEIHWKIEPLDENRSLLKFEHSGLVPELQCYSFCSKSWIYFLEHKLVDYLRKSKNFI